MTTRDLVNYVESNPPAGLTTVEVLTLWTCAYYADRQGIIRVSQGEIADKLGKSDRYIRQAFATLVTVGEIEHDGDGRKGRYRLVRLDAEPGDEPADDDTKKHWRRTWKRKERPATKPASDPDDDAGKRAFEAEARAEFDAYQSSGSSWDD